MSITTKNLTLWRKLFVASREKAPILMASAQGWSFFLLPTWSQRWENYESLPTWPQSGQARKEGSAPFQGGYVGLVSFDAMLRRLLEREPLYPVQKFFPEEFWVRVDRLLAFAPDGSIHPFGEGMADFLASVQVEEGDLPLYSLPKLAMTWDFERYAKAFAQVQEAILEGEFYETNLTLLAQGETNLDPLDYFLSGAAVKQPSMGLYMEQGSSALASFSPERLVRIELGAKGERLAFAEPIKGTMPKGGDPQALLADAKCEAELNMIVDLLRNDMAPFAKPGSLRLSRHRALMELEKVWHTSSRVSLLLKDDFSLTAFLNSLLPGGSITGCPKKRAVTLTERIEGRNRGLYCGSFFYLDDSGALDANILIRTSLLYPHKQKPGHHHIDYGTGSGVIRTSSLEQEWRELGWKIG